VIFREFVKCREFEYLKNSFESYLLERDRIVLCIKYVEFKEFEIFRKFIIVPDYFESYFDRRSSIKVKQFFEKT